MSKLKVLVVGASIAGPTVAYWLAKAGASVTVIERFPKLRTNGQNIDIRTAGVTVMRKMPGMEAAVRSKTMEMEGISFVRDNGRPFATIKATGNPDQQSLVSEYEIFRGDLAQILFDLTKDNENTKYVFGEKVASIQQDEKDDGPVTVEFANGLATSKYDLVVACDGATSRTRAIGLGGGVRDHIKPTNSWATFFSIDQDLLQGSKMGQTYSATGGRFIAAGPDPSGMNRVVLMGIHPRDDGDAALPPFREAMSQGDDALKRFVARHYEGAGWKTEEIVKGMMKTSDFYANEIVQVKTPSLYKGRFALVGDAGYAPDPTGTGTTLAITGAYILAGEVGRHKGNLAAGLRSYEERMRPLIDDMQKIPSLVHTILAPQTAWGI
ncbi:putative oxidoreductase [Phaeomoniella chlamydospora]|uniref:Putative oxidoreductase n=1 Tax=Phaeomoniella chlamydospora TaxID=158046 RepID=A0A0G2FQC0_PHACM|nr:putative oxidoreductase [Phaeomoniella chlamydospora]